MGAEDEGKGTRRDGQIAWILSNFMDASTPMKINLSSLTGSLGSAALVVGVFAYAAIIAPATEAGKRERATHAAVREYKTALHDGLSTGDSYLEDIDDLYDSDDSDAPDVAAVGRMIAVPNGEVVEWLLGPRPLWWEIGSLDNWATCRRRS